MCIFFLFKCLSNLLVLYSFLIRAPIIKFWTENRQYVLGFQKCPSNTWKDFLKSRLDLHMHWMRSNRRLLHFSFLPTSTFPPSCPSAGFNSWLWEAHSLQPGKAACPRPLFWWVQHIVLGSLPHPNVITAQCKSLLVSDATNWNSCRAFS